MEIGATWRGTYYRACCPELRHEKRQAASANPKAPPSGRNRAIVQIRVRRGGQQNHPSPRDILAHRIFICADPLARSVDWRGSDLQGGWYVAIVPEFRFINWYLFAEGNG
jgi:hypothetical protein